MHTAFYVFTVQLSWTNPFHMYMTLHWFNRNADKLVFIHIFGRFYTIAVVVLSEKVGYDFKMDRRTRSLIYINLYSLFTFQVSTKNSISKMKGWRTDVHISIFNKYQTIFFCMDICMLKIAHSQARPHL
jgi:hypothetical protein